MKPSLGLILAMTVINANGADSVAHPGKPTKQGVTENTNSVGKIAPSLTTSQDPAPYVAHVRYADKLKPALEDETSWKVYKTAIGTNSIIRTELLPAQRYVTTGERDSIPTLHRASWTPLPREERAGPEPGITLLRFTRMPFEGPVPVKTPRKSGQP